MNHESWKDIYGFWGFIFQEHWLPQSGLFLFENLRVDLLPGLNHDQAYDWWPKEEINSRKSSLMRETLSPQQWETKKGTLHTVQQLFSSVGNIEQQTAIWIMASLYDKKHSPSTSWGEESKKIIYEMFNSIKEEFPKVERWSNVTREVLPFSLIGEGLYKNVNFSNPEQLLYLLVAEAALINGNWRLIAFNQA